MASGLGRTARLVEWSLRSWAGAQLEEARHRLPHHAQAERYWRDGRGATALADQIRKQLPFALAQAAWQLSSPRDQEVVQVAGLLLGSPHAEGLEILVDSIIIAGSPRNSAQRKQAEHRAAIAGGDLFVRGFFLGG